MTSHRSAHRAIRCMLLASTVGLSGCASFSPDGGMSVVSDLASQTIKKDVVFVRSADDAETADRAMKRLLSRALTVDTAVQIALLNNKGLQAAYNELALAETELVGQSLPPNPTFSISRISGDGASEIERQVVGDILALATLPFRSEIARDRFRQAQLKRGAGDAAARRRGPARLFRAVAANETVALLDRREIDRGSDRATGGQARRDRRDQQARSGPRAGVLCRDHRRPRGRASGGDELARAADAADGAVGRRSRLQAARQAAGAAAPAAGAAARSRPTRSATASTCRSRAWSWRRWRNRSISPKRPAS